MAEKLEAGGPTDFAKNRGSTGTRSIPDSDIISCSTAQTRVFTVDANENLRQIVDLLNRNNMQNVETARQLRDMQVAQDYASGLALVCVSSDAKAQPTHLLTLISRPYFSRYLA